MIKSVLSAFILLSMQCMLFAQVTFEKTFGGTDYDFGYSIRQTTDGGYIIAGETSSFGAGSSDVYLIKTNSFGDTVWTGTYGGSSGERAFSVWQTNDGGYIAGEATSVSGSTDIYLVRTNSSGDTLWTKTYGGSNDDSGYCIRQTTDGGYVVAGITHSFGAGSYDFYILKLNSSGDTLWTKTFGGTDGDVAYSIEQTTDSGYIIAGTTGSFGAGSTDVYLIKTNASGDTLWTKTYGGSDGDGANSVQQTTDGGYIIVGSTSSYGAGSSDMYLIKVNSSGDTIWTQTYGGTGNDSGISGQQTNDGGYFIAGNTNSFGAGSLDIYLVKTDSDGVLLWERTFGGIGLDVAYSASQTTDGGYVIAGVTNSFGAGGYDAYMIKTDENGLVNINDIPEQNIISIFPNPTHNIINIELNSKDKVDVEMTDMTGKTLLQQKATGKPQITIDVSGYKPGVYFISVKSDNFIKTEKIIKY